MRKPYYKIIAYNTNICATNTKKQIFKSKKMARLTFRGDNTQLIFSNNKIGDCVIDMIENIEDEEVWLQYIISKKDIPRIIKILEEIQQNKLK